MGQGAKLSHQATRLDAAIGANRTRLLPRNVVQVPEPADRCSCSHGPFQRARTPHPPSLIDSVGRFCGSFGALQVTKPPG